MASRCSCSECGESSDNQLNAYVDLFQSLNHTGIECFNELEEDSGKSVFQPYEDRYSRKCSVKSDDGVELMFIIPFTNDVKLKGICILGGEGDSHPNLLKIYKNRPLMTLEGVNEIEPDHQIELVRDSTHAYVYPLKLVKFSSVQYLTLYFYGNEEADHTHLYYIGLSGEHTTTNRHGVTICAYEARPLAADHKKKYSIMTNKPIQ